MTTKIFLSNHVLLEYHNKKKKEKLIYDVPGTDSRMKLLYCSGYSDRSDKGLISLEAKIR